MGAIDTRAATRLETLQTIKHASCKIRLKKRKGIIVQDQIQTLLNDVAFKIGALKEAKRLYADRLAPDFNIFDYLRDDEMGLSRCIKSLLDPTGTHGQGNLFLKDFLSRIDKVLSEKQLVKNWTDTVTDDCQVSLEKQTYEKRRIDVYLRFKNGEIIGIENKPWAWDQENQLADYAEFIKGQAKSNWLIIYLSNNDPSNSDYSIDKKQREALEKAGNFIWLDYAELIEWLEFCSQKSKALAVRIFIEELAKYIRMKINGELDMSEEQEVKSIILKSDESIRSAFHISKSLKSVKEKLLKDFHDDLEERLNSKDFKLVWDETMSEGWKSYSGFGVKFNNEQNFYLRFEFLSGLHDLYWGIKRESDAIKKDTALWSEISALMNKFGSASKSESWPWWSWIDKNPEFGSEFRHWDSSETPWVYMMSSNLGEVKLAKKITNLAINVRDAFGDKLNLLSEGLIKQADA